MNLCKTIRPVTVASGGLQAIFLHFGAKVRKSIMSCRSCQWFFTFFYKYIAFPSNFETASYELMEPLFYNEFTSPNEKVSAI